MDKKKLYYHNVIGSNYRMTNIQAAIGLAQLSKINYLLKSRKKIFEYYNKRFKQLDILRLLPSNNWSTNSYWLYTVVIKNFGKKKRDLLIKRLLKSGIETRPGFLSFDQMTIYKKYCVGSYKVSREISDNSISLPSTFISQSEQDWIISFFIKELNKILKL
jgi:perosamine synthetase